MLLNNARLSSFVHYFDISSYLEKGKLIWVAWYFEELQSSDPLLTTDPKAAE